MKAYLLYLGPIDGGNSSFHSRTKNIGEQQWKSSHGLISILKGIFLINSLILKQKENRSFS